tara:strand:- start:3039 stop:3746 length:708 start_codon:yes stop_codon:yes gene_type:complete
MIDTKIIKYYLIHNLDINRKNIMLNEFNKWGFDLSNIKWINHPNKNEISDELIDKLIIKEPSYSSNVYIPPERTRSEKGLVCCTYKHYLALKDIVDNNYDYGVIMEDNTYFTGPIPKLIKTYIKQLDEIYREWDIVFDRNWKNYDEGPIKPNLFVYPKSNEIKPGCHGGTKAASFYLVTNKCAKLLIEHYIPFNNSPDWWMNDLFRKLNIKSFWIEPAMAHYPNTYNHKSTCGGK